MNTPIKCLRRFALCLAVLAGGACSGIDNTSSRNILIPNETLNISRSLSIPAESIAAGVLLYLVIDPLAPNWQIEQAQLGANRFLVALKKKRFTTGGDGEAGQIFNRRAAQIARDNGTGVYRIVEFTEGIESTVPFAQRVAQGVVEIVR
jgi:hypothetical protein